MLLLRVPPIEIVRVMVKQVLGAVVAVVLTWIV